MNPLSLRASGYRSFDELSFDLPEGLAAIVGPTGAGKSSYVEAIELALYGSCRSGALALPLRHSIAPDADALEIELTFEHAGELYRVRRGYSAKGRGKTTLDLEVQLLHATEPVYTWEPLTRESQKETQALLESTIGLSHTAFRASSFIGQSDAGAFTQAAPRERKAILGELVGLAVWARLAEKAGADRRQIERALSELAGRISLLEETAGARDELEEACSRLRLLVSGLEEEHRAREQELHDAAVAAQEAEKAEATYATRRSEVLAAQAALSGRQAVVDRAAAAKLEAVEIARELSGAGDPEAKLASLEERRAALVALVERRREAEREREILLGEAGEAEKTIERLQTERSDVRDRGDTAAAKAAALNDPANRHECDRCGQEVRGEAFDRTLASLREERDEAERRVAAYTARIEELAQHAETKRRLAGELEIPDAPEVSDYNALVDEIKTARAAELTVAAAKARLEGLHTVIAEVTPELTDELARLNEALADAEVALAEFPQPEPGAIDALRHHVLLAKGELDSVLVRERQAKDDLARAEAKLEQAQKIAVELADCQARREALHGELDLLTTLERAYGRDGIPALIVEASAIPQIETEANRILAELAPEFRVELHTQRELRSGDGLADTLDIVISDPSGTQREYATFSGGERGCIDFALRFALAEFLANRKDAPSEILVVDEIEGLDESRQAALMGVLEGLRSRFSKILVISHHSALRDAPVDHVIEVVNEDGRSRIVGAREAVAA